MPGGATPGRGGAAASPVERGGSAERSRAGFSHAGSRCRFSAGRYNGANVFRFGCSAWARDGVVPAEEGVCGMLYDNIMVPYDGSPSARAALEEAARFANEDPGLTLRIVTIIDAESRVAAYLEKHPLPEGVVPSARLREIHQQVVDEADADLHRQIDHILERLMNRVVIEFLEETSPGAQIVSYASDNNCDLIIMGSRGLGALRGMLGSVSSYVLREATCPVMVVKVGD